MAFIYALSDAWTNGATTYSSIQMNVTTTAYAAASQLLDLQTGGTQRFGVRAPHNALGSNTTPTVNIVDVWNTSGAITGIKYNVTDTASASASLLMDLQVGGSSKFSVAKNGSMFASFGSISTGTNEINLNYYQPGVGVSSSGQFTFSSGSSASGADTYLTRSAAASLRLGAADAAAPVAQTLGVQSVVAGTSNTAGVNFTIKGSAGTGTGAGGSIIFQVSPPGASGTGQNAFATAWAINSNKQLVSSGTGAGVYTDLDIGAGAANTGIKGGSYSPKLVSNASTVATWSYTSGFSIGGSEDVQLWRDAANTLALRNGASAQTFNVYETYTDSSNYARGFIRAPASAAVEIGAEGAGTGSTTRSLVINVGGSQRWQFQGSSGNLLAVADNQYDIGATSSGRPRNVYVSNSLTVTGTGSFRGTTVGQPAEYLSWSGSSKINAATDGLLALYNAAASDFGRLQFGGTTSSFPALKRSSATLQVRLADDSAFADLTAANLSGSTLTASSTTTNTAAIAASSYSLTGSSAVNMVDLSGTWNTSGVPTGIKLNITNTASGAGSLLMDLQIGAASKFKVDKDGNTTWADAANLAVGTTTGTKIGTATSQKIGFWNATPIVQPTTGVAAATVAGTGAGDVVAASTTFDGYTIPQIVKAMRNAGLLA